jgi:hypothetical protein
MKHSTFIIMIILLLGLYPAISFGVETSNPEPKYGSTTKIVVATVAILGILTYVKGEDLSELLTDLILGTTPEQKHIEKSNPCIQIPWDDNYNKKLKELQNRLGIKT